MLNQVAAGAWNEKNPFMKRDERCLPFLDLFLISISRFISRLTETTGVGIGESVEGIKSWNSIWWLNKI